jgi:CheY-like chemotaxis protein
MPNEIKNSKSTGTPAMPSKGSVLVVDDEEQNRNLLRDLLDGHGYQVATAANGLQALETVAKNPPDVVLLDLMMPQMDGFEVCRRLKAAPDTAHIPILIVTALSQRKERMMGIAAGANDFLTKPIDSQDVILRVRNAVQITQLHNQLQTEKKKSERLLLNILPEPIAERMRNEELTIADYIPEATVLVAGLVGFNALSKHIDPEQVVFLLNEIFSAFDELTEQYGLEKIKTNGEIYVAAGGVPSPRRDHAEAIAELALSMREQIGQFNRQYDTSFLIRIGINSGPLIAGVIGRRKFVYDIWGETVNLASRLDSTADAGTIQIGETTYERLKDKYRLEKRHSVEPQGYGNLPAYSLEKRV